MMHFANEGEASSVKMKALTESLVANTKWQNVFSTEYCWRKTRKNPRDSQSGKGEGQRGSPSGMVVVQEHNGVDPMSEGVSYYNWNGKGRAWINP